MKESYTSRQELDHNEAERCLQEGNETLRRGADQLRQDADRIRRLELVLANQTKSTHQQLREAVEQSSDESQFFESVFSDERANYSMSRDSLQKAS